MKKLVMWEILLILASVLMFRSFWVFLDGFDWMNSTAGLLVSFAAGMLLAGRALAGINSR
ncbi:MAG: hypothetical protein FD189_1486 [Elusimicrobia bacterium]|nr:MAG: hypothetical protein FD154_1374 [Elusimicrobiota bacterium]KAF0155252.1 MAG: hypothetical protein FD189_1486 [Elusimicrobiota bacterium]